MRHTSGQLLSKMALTDETILNTQHVNTHVFDIPVGDADAYVYTHIVGDADAYVYTHIVGIADPYCCLCRGEFICTLDRMFDVCLIVCLILFWIECVNDH